MSGRLKSEKKASEVAEYLMAPFLKDQSEYFNVHLEIHKAHVVMLSEVGLLTKDETRLLLIALEELEAAGEGTLTIHLNTDLYMQVERFVVERTGDLGGRMHTGRSRNDLYSTATRLMMRDKLLALLADVVQLQNELLTKAKEHAGTVMPGYTHLQHAEPVTFGHYLLAEFDSIQRDIRRLSAAYEETNLSTLGAAALAGSSFPLDRNLTADLLGLDGIVENTYDAVASRDFLLQATSAVAILCSSLARVTDHFILWVTSEHDMLDLPDGYCYTSSIMPQKRNPGFFLESLRARSARVTGSLMAALTTVKGTIFAHSRDMSYEINVPVEQAFTDATAMVKVITGVISSIEPRKEKMLKTCADHFSGATELANLFVRENGLPFRSAYKIVAMLVQQATEQAKRPNEVTVQDVEQISLAILGQKILLSEDKLHAALDPARNVEMKQTAGSPSRARIEEMLVSRKKNLDENKKNVDAYRTQITDARSRLSARVSGYVGEESEQTTHAI